MRKRPLLAICLCITVFFAVRLYGSPPLEDDSAVSILGVPLENGEIITVSGQVYQIKTRESYGRELALLFLTSVVIQKEHTSSGEDGISCSKNLICEISQDARPKIGSEVRIKGKFNYFSHATNEGEFDAAQYYRIQDVAGSIKKARLLGCGRKFSLWREGLYQLKLYWKERLFRIFPEKEASVLCTMLLGDKDMLDSEVKELYQRNGIVHILSISGLHITFIGMGIYKLLRRLGCPKMIAALAGGFLLIQYGILTGMGVSACRAIGMYLIRMLGECVGRTYDMMTALGVMAVIMLMKQPKYLRHSGFVLSFCSICGIGLLLPALQITLPVKQKTRNLKAAVQTIVSGLQQSFLAGLSITLFTLPVQLYFYYEIPVYSVFLNLLVLPLMSIVMVVGLAVLLIPGAGILMGIVQWILSGYEMACLAAEKLPFHTWTPGCPRIWQIAVYYILLSVVIIFGNYCARRIKISKENSKILSGQHSRLWGSYVILLVAAVLQLGVRFHSGVTVTFLDVGQGDCIFVRTDQGENYLFDAGSSDKSQIGNSVIIPFLKYHGIRHLDAVFVSHPDKDHCSGILELIESGKQNGISVEKLILPDISDKQKEEDLRTLRSGVRAAGAAAPTIAYISRGTNWQSGSTKFMCLHPASGMETEDVNSYSECFLMEYEGFSMLLTGDVQGDGERELMQELTFRQTGKITVLKVAHHGSRNSTPTQLLDRLQPALAVISCGADNSYGHPHAELIERLEAEKCVILKTPETGAVTVIANRKGIKVYSVLLR